MYTAVLDKIWSVDTTPLYMKQSKLLVPITYVHMCVCCQSFDFLHGTSNLATGLQLEIWSSRHLRRETWRAQALRGTGGGLHFWLLHNRWNLLCIVMYWYVVYDGRMKRFPYSLDLFLYSAFAQQYTALLNGGWFAVVSGLSQKACEASTDADVNCLELRRACCKFACYWFSSPGSWEGMKNSAWQFQSISKCGPFEYPRLWNLYELIAVIQGALKTWWVWFRSGACHPRWLLWCWASWQFVKVNDGPCHPRNGKGTSL